MNAGTTLRPAVASPWAEPGESVAALRGERVRGSGRHLLARTLWMAALTLTSM